MSHYSRKEEGFRSTKSSRSNITYENLHRRKPTSNDSKNINETHHNIEYNSIIRADRRSTFQNAETTITKDHNSTTTLE
jgi:hypothetical protein